MPSNAAIQLPQAAKFLDNSLSEIAMWHKTGRLFQFCALQLTIMIASSIKISHRLRPLSPVKLPRSPQPGAAPSSVDH